MDRKTSTSFPDFTPTSGALARMAAVEQRGDKPLAILGNARLSYAEADARSAELAKGLLASGAGKGTRVRLLAGNSPDWIVGWLGITPAWARWRCCSTPTTRRGSSGGRSGTAMPRCC